ncbi:ankyrin repeat-containing domain protein [Aspergillus heterothallicus]
MILILVSCSSYATFSARSGDMAKHAPRISNAEWERRRQTIVSLYLESNTTLDRTITAMKELHGFEASKNQYRTRLKQWKISKNATSDMWIYVNKTIRQRQTEGKETNVFLHGKLLPRRKVIKEIARNVTFSDLLPNRQEASPPVDITLATPPCSPLPTQEGPPYAKLLPSMQLRAKFLYSDIEIVLDFSTDDDDDSEERHETVMWFVFSSSRYDDFIDEKLGKALRMCPKSVLPHTIEADLLDLGLTHRCHPAARRMDMLLFLAINNEVPRRVLYGSLLKLLEEFSESWFEFIWESTSTAIKLLRRLILYGAVEAGNIEIAQRVTESGIKLTPKDDLITVAFLGRHVCLVELLCKAGATLKISEYPSDIFSQKQDVEMLRLLLEAGADSMRVIENKMTGSPLILAAERGCLEAVRLLLRHGADVNVYDPRRHGSALQAAAESGNLEVVEKLLACGADIDVSSRSVHRVLLAETLQDSQNDAALVMKRPARTPIQIAAAENNFDLCVVLQSHGAYLNCRPIVYRTQQVYENRPDMAIPREEGVLTSLQYAVKNQNVAIISLLLSSGADPNLGAHHYGDTPLQISAKLGNERIALILVEAGAEINALPQRSGGRTALQAAAEAGNISMAKLLIEHGANVNAPPGNDQGLTAIQGAARGGHEHMVDFLLANGADAKALPAMIGGLTAFQAAAAGGHKHVVERLIRLYAVEDSVAPDCGRTAFQAAVQHRDLKILHLIFSRGAAVNAPPSASCGTALQEASKHGWLVGAQYLLDQGASINARPLTVSSASYGLTALGWAIYNNDFKMLQLLLKYNADTQSSPGDPQKSQCALLYALYRGAEFPLVEALFQREGKDFPGIPPIPYEVALRAAIRGHSKDPRIFELLLRKTNSVPSAPYIRQDAWHDIIGSGYLDAKAEMDQLKVIYLFLLWGMDIDEQHREKKVTCLQMALHHGCENIAKFLIERGASPNTPATVDVATPLQEAINRCYFDIIELILHKEVDVNAAPARLNGGTALQLAAGEGLFGVVFRLLELGADVAAPAAEEGGRTAIDGATENGRIDMIQILLNAYKGDETIQDVCKRAAGYAEYNGHVEIAEWLVGYCG